jgi:hypothetical protein
MGEVMNIPAVFDVRSLVIFLVPILVLLAIFGRAYRIAAKARFAAWSMRNVNVVIGGHSPAKGLDVSFGDTSVETMSIARIALWNPRFQGAPVSMTTGNGSLRLESATPNVRILEARIIQSNVEPGESAHLHTSLNRQRVDITLPRLTYQQGAVLQVAHTGTTANDLQLTSDGSQIPLKFFPPDTVRLNRPRGPKFLQNTRMRPIPLTGFFVVTWIVAFVTRSFWLENQNVISAFHTWDIVAFVAALSSFSFHRHSRPTRKRNALLPASLNSFFES